MNSRKKHKIRAAATLAMKSNAIEPMMEYLADKEAMTYAIRYCKYKEGENLPPL